MKRPARRVRAAVLERAASRCEEPDGQGRRCTAAAVAVLATGARSDDRAPNDPAQLRAVCQGHARQAYSRAAVRGNAPRRVDRSVEPWGGRQQRRARALATDAGRCRARNAGGDECALPATTVVRLRAHPDAPLLDRRRSLCDEHAREHRAAAARQARPTAALPAQLTGAAARIAAQLDDLGASPGITHAQARALLQAAGHSVGGTGPRELAVAYRRARDDAAPQLQLLLDVVDADPEPDAAGLPVEHPADSVSQPPAAGVDRAQRRPPMPEAVAVARAAVDALRPNAPLLAATLAAAQRAGADPSVVAAAQNAADLLAEALTRLGAALNGHEGGG